MAKIKGEEFKFVIPPEIQAKIDAEPGLAEALRDINAQIRQALDGVDTNDPVAVEAAMRAIGAEPYEDDDE